MWTSPTSNMVPLLQATLSSNYYWPAHSQPWYKSEDPSQVSSKIIEIEDRIYPLLCTSF